MREQRVDDRASARGASRGRCTRARRGRRAGQGARGARRRSRTAAPRPANRSAGRGLDERIARRDGPAARAAPPAEQQPGHDGHVVTVRDRRPAVRACRAWRRRSTRFAAPGRSPRSGTSPTASPRRAQNPARIPNDAASAQIDRGTVAASVAVQCRGPRDPRGASTLRAASPRRWRSPRGSDRSSSTSWGTEKRKPWPTSTSSTCSGRRWSSSSTPWATV